jgi:large subunit ribosomal protein L5
MAKAKAKGKKGGEGAAAEAPAAALPPEEKVPPRLQEVYKTSVAPALQKRFEYKSAMQVPRLVKITLNVGLGEATQNPKLLDAAADEIARMTGQKPVIQKAKKAIANFRLRENQRIGVTVTLRRQRMWEFLDRLVNVALPRVRDFRGVSPRAFDGRGNYTLGLREQIIFPEVDYDRVEKIRGLNVSIVTTARTDEEGLALLTGLGMPFRT